jgi:transcriptional regulator with XRE-family HTH domain
VGTVTAVSDVESLARSRLRSLRTTLGYSLDELAERTNLSPSTISRVETGKRSLGLDVLVPLAAALQVSLDVLFEMPSDEDVVIRPVAHTSGDRTTWPLSRPDGPTVAMKMRLEPSSARPEQRVHPGYDWFVVLDGRARLWLGDRQIDVDAGEAAEFSTMTPHSISAPDGPAELIMIFDREGQRAHVHH